MAPNPFLLAADNSAALLPLLRENPELASKQDDHGYSLVHAAASYNHLDLLRTLVREFNVNVDLTDEDNETALFVVETPEAAEMLVAELGANPQHKGLEGLTALDKIEAEGEFPAVVRYLTTVTEVSSGPEARSATATSVPAAIPPPPEGLSVSLGTMDEAFDIPQDADPELRRRIEELAERDDFNTPEGQAQLRNIVMDVLTGNGFGEGRSVKPKKP